MKPNKVSLPAVVMVPGVLSMNPEQCMAAMAAYARWCKAVDALTTSLTAANATDEAEAFAALLASGVTVHPMIAGMAAALRTAAGVTQRPLRPDMN